MFDLNSVSLEGIDVQKSSPGCIALTNYFQTVIDYRESLKKDNPEITAATLNKQVIDFFKRNSKKFSEIVKSYFGLKVTKLHIAESLCGMFAVELDIGPNPEKNFSNYSGIKYFRKSTEQDSIDKIYNDLSKNIDLEHSVLLKDTFGSGKRNYELETVMYFDPYLAFLSKTIVSKFVPEFTAAEIAAIMTHEIGHVMVFAERSGQTFATWERVKQYASNVNNIEDVAKKTKELKDFFNTHKYNEAMTKKDQERIGKILDTTENLIQKTQDSVIGGVLKVALMIFARVYMVLTMGIFGFFLNLFTIREIQSIQRQTQSSTKQSDMASSERRWFLNERLADEFATRHGMGSYLVSGLDKFKKIFDVAGTTMVNNDRVLNSKVAFYLARILAFGESLIYGAFTTIIYENDFNRARRVLQNTLHILGEELPKDAQDMYIKNYEETLKIVDKNDGIARRVKEKLNNFFGDFTVTEQVFMNIKNGKLLHELEVLGESIENITKNKMTYFASKLEQMSRTA